MTSEAVHSLLRENSTLQESGVVEFLCGALLAEEEGEDAPASSREAIRDILAPFLETQPQEELDELTNKLASLLLSSSGPSPSMKPDLVPSSSLGADQKAPPLAIKNNNSNSFPVEIIELRKTDDKPVEFLYEKKLTRKEKQQLKKQQQHTEQPPSSSSSQKKSTKKSSKGDDDDDDDDDDDESDGPGYSADSGSAPEEEEEEEEEDGDELGSDEDEDELFAETQNSRFHADHVGDSREIYLRGISLAFQQGVDLLENATLKLKPGCRYGLVGKNGVGKSTLLAAIANKSLKDFPAYISTMHVRQEIVGGMKSALQIVLEGDEYLMKLKTEEKTLAAKNELDASQASRLTEIYSLLQAHDADNAEKKAIDLLERFEFTPEMWACPSENLSGGWRMRIAIARAMFLEPEVLMLDEPSNHLDLPSIIWLQDIVRSYEKCVVVVTHDRAFMNAVCTDIILFDKKKLAYFNGNFDTFLKVREEKKQRQQHQFDWQTRLEKHIKTSIENGLKSAIKRGDDKALGMVASRKKKLDRLGIEKREDGKKWKIHKRRKDGSFDLQRVRATAVEEEPPVVFKFLEPDAIHYQGPLIQVRHISFKYPGDKSPFIFKDVVLDLDSKGDRLALLGKNGEGKSTLMSILAGELQPTSGSVHKHHNLVIGYFNQHHVDQLDLAKTPLSHIIQAIQGLGEQDARKALGSFGLGGRLALMPIRLLSGGQKSRVVLATLAWKRPHLLLLDEITNHLDYESVDGMIEALKAFEGSIVMVSHDQYFVQHVATKLYVVERQAVSRFEGSFASYISSLRKSLKKK